jgi:hypothetical protein
MGANLCHNGFRSLTEATIRWSYWDCWNRFRALKLLNLLPWSIEIVGSASMVHWNFWISFRGPLKLLNILPWSMEIVESASVVPWNCWICFHDPLKLLNLLPWSVESAAWSHWDSKNQTFQKRKISSDYFNYLNEFEAIFKFEAVQWVVW